MIYVQFRPKVILVIFFIVMSLLTQAALSGAAPSTAAIIPADRVVDWTQAGIPGGIPSVSEGASVLDYGAVPNDGQDDSSAFQEAIDAVKGTTNNAITIPAGDYNINTSLEIDDSVVLRGVDPTATRLIFDVGNADAIEVVTYQRGDWVDVVDGMAKGSTTLTVSNAAAFTSGDFFEIQQDNDPDKMYTDPRWEQGWAEQSVGQIGVVEAVDGNTLSLREPLNIDFDTNLNPVIRTQGLVSYVGIENLHLDRSGDTGDASMILWKNAAYTWVRNVESEFAAKSHIGANTVYRCEVRDSYFHEAHNYGGGGHGYGVELGYHTTGCLTQNSIFETLRHAMMVHLGANGNVFAYNYSRDPVSDSGTLPDISIHGHYPFGNLFEGNVVSEIGIGDFWGPAGPYNTYLRNCVYHEGLWHQDQSHTQNIVGNELPDASGNFLGARDDDTSAGVLEHGNYVDGAVQWDPTIPEREIPSSYLYTNKPDFYGTMSWPSTGADIAVSCTNPAKVRYETGDPGVPTPTPCVDCPTPTPTSMPEPTSTPVDGACMVDYEVGNEWNDGFRAEITITNNVSTPIVGWTLTWIYAEGQQVERAWNADVTQSGNSVTAANPASHWNGTIEANGGIVTFGMVSTHTGTVAVPTDFVLNGTACTGN